MEKLYKVSYQGDFLLAVGDDEDAQDKAYNLIVSGQACGEFDFDCDLEEMTCSDDIPDDLMGGILGSDKHCEEFFYHAKIEIIISRLKKMGYDELDSSFAEDLRKVLDEENLTLDQDNF